MTEPTRRQIIGGLLSLPALPAFAEILCGSAPLAQIMKYQAVIFFHGLFVLKVEKDSTNITALAPKVMDHVYRGGKEEGNDLKSSHTFSGMTPNPQFLPNRKLYPVFQNSQVTIDEQYCQCKVTIPKPDRIMPLRKIEVISGKPFYKGKPEKLPSQPSLEPHLLALLYKNCSSPPALTPPNGQILTGAAPYIWHFRAEPLHDPGAGNDAMVALQNMLGLKADEFDISPDYYDAPGTAADENTVGIKKNQQCNLNEYSQGICSPQTAQQFTIHNEEVNRKLKQSAPKGVVPPAFRPVDCKSYIVE